MTSLYEVTDVKALSMLGPDYVSRQSNTHAEVLKTNIRISCLQGAEEAEEGFMVISSGRRFTG